MKFISRIRIEVQCRRSFLALPPKKPPYRGKDTTIGSSSEHLRFNKFIAKPRKYRASRVFGQALTKRSASLASPQCLRMSAQHVKVPRAVGQQKRHTDLNKSWMACRVLRTGWEAYFRLTQTARAVHVLITNSCDARMRDVRLRQCRPGTTILRKLEGLVVAQRSCGFNHAPLPKNRQRHRVAKLN